MLTAFNLPMYEFYSDLTSVIVLLWFPGKRTFWNVVI